VRCYLIPLDDEPAPPSVIPDDVLTDWTHHYNFALDDYGFNLTGVSAVWVEGVGIQATPVAYGDRLAGVSRNMPTPAAEGFTFTFMWAKFTSWPTPGEGGVSFWFRLNNVTLLNDVSLFGLPVVQTRTNTHLAQGELMEVSWVSTLDNPPSGTHVLAELIIAGTGNDPYPTDPAYVPS